MPDSETRTVHSASPRMVTLVREAKGWSQADLANASGVTQGFVSKVENGLTELTAERLAAFAEALDCPTSLLTNHEAQQGIEVSCMFHRRRQSRITVGTAKKIEAVSHLTRITVDALLEEAEVDRGAETILERMDIDDFDGDAAHIARLLRAGWRIPSGPIGNLHALLDGIGIVIVIRTLDSAAQDAFSTWPRGKTPLMVVRAGLPPDRERFSICHELGHIVMHVLPNPEQEKQADLFAAEFLMPADDIRPQLLNLTTRDFPRLMDLKAQWKVSIAALIQRAKTLDLISDRQFREFRIKLSKLGWNTVEPIDLPVEQSVLLDGVIETHRTRYGRNDADLARLAYMTPEAFRKHYLRETNRTSLQAVRS
ncbi:helix-turn-helix domain-containing protein [Nocardia wallacei]|uniref:helix-turn-helix domain-containing protein n=1 Tax=Nocardia wallacei TaxID=480035 RepID=UPI002458CA62|nr:XRE family transcriptional regulator [Nocardia wallacei]